MIESIMYLGIGFLAASISVLAVVPIVHTRAVRLTTRQLVDTMPSSVAEIAADKDLLRAEFAMSTRTLEMKVDQLKGKGAGQQRCQQRELSVPSVHCQQSHQAAPSESIYFTN